VIKFITCRGVINRFYNVLSFSIIDGCGYKFVKLWVWKFSGTDFAQKSYTLYFAGWAELRFPGGGEVKISPPVNATRAKNTKNGPVKYKLRSMELAGRRQLHSFALK